MSTMLEQTLGLLEETRERYADDPQTAGRLERVATRLREPLRVALAGRIKAGKSTLLNAIVGEQLAPTDTGECTRVVTWYRHGDVPDVRAVLRDGGSARLPVRRADGRLLLDTGGHPPATVARLEVAWPSPALRTMTLIDTPGLASLSTEVSRRTTEALTPQEGHSEVDAVVYLMRHLHSTDAELMEAFREATVGGASPVGTVAVLSRADEIGGGRIEAMVSAADVARRYAADARVRAMAFDVVPVAGLLAEGARTLRQVDVDALREVARLAPAERESLLVSAQRFGAQEHPQLQVATPALRSQLLERLGTFGVRLATALLRGPVVDATSLAGELTRRSGMGPLTTALGSHLQHRSELLRSRTALAALEEVLRGRTDPAAAGLLARVEELRGTDHALEELDWLTRLRRDEVGGLEAGLRAEAERLLGLHGARPADRLGLSDPDPEDPAAQDRVAREALERWRLVAADPLSDPRTVAAATAVIRSVDELLARPAAR